MVQRASGGYHGVMKIVSLVHIGMVSLSAALLAGCARTPPGATTGAQTLVTFEVQVAGQIVPGDPNAYYYIVLDTDNNPATGPIPVVARPWGNGYAAGSYTHYVLYHNGVFGVYESIDPNHTTSTYLGRPLQGGITTTNRPNDTLFVQVDRAQIADIHPDVRAIDVNVISTDRVPLDPQELTVKVVDGLGASGNDYVTIPFGFTTVYTNGVDPDPAHPETPRDADGLANNPNLDLINWRITVQTQ
jgi:hypothetical protein